MSTKRSLALMLAIGLASSAARAGFPGTGNAGETQRSLLRYVCSNAPATQCVVDPGSGQFDPATTCGSATATCQVDYVANAEIRALLTVISQDRTPAVTDFADTRNTILLEFKIGNDSYAIAEAFDPQSSIGEWFNVPTERDIFRFDFAGGALLEGSLAPIRQKLLQLGRARLGVPTGNVVPVIVEGIVPSVNTPKPQELETNQSCVPNDTDPSCPPVGSGPGQPLASVARYRVTVKYAPCIASVPFCTPP